MEIKPIAYIHTDFKEKFGIPRQSGRVPSLTGKIVFEPEFRDPDAIRGIEEFSHLWLVFCFSKALRDKHSLTVRPPRLGGNTKVGVFASRSPFRPNSLGLSVVKLEKIIHEEKSGFVLIVSGIDLLDNTPIFDIKPYIPYADSIKDAKGSFAEQMSGHRLDVNFPSHLLEEIPQSKQDAVINCLADDPRPSYQDDGRTYSMNFNGIDIHFNVSENTLNVLGVEKIY